MDVFNWIFGRLLFPKNTQIKYEFGSGRLIFEFPPLDFEKKID